MNKNTLIGLTLIGLILFGFSWYNTKQYSQQVEKERAAQREQAIKDSILFANSPKPTTDSLAQSATTTAALAATTTDTTIVKKPLEQAKTGKEEFHTLKNNHLKLTFSNRGGRIAAVELPEHKRYGGDPLLLMKEESSKFGLSFYTPELVNTAELYLTPQNITKESITYRLWADSASYLDLIYTLKAEDYMVDLKVDLSHFKGALVPNHPDLKLNWAITSPQQEKGYTNENNNTTVYYKYPGVTDVEKIGMGDQTKTEELPTKVQWVAFKQQFFSSVIISREANFTKSKIGFDTYPEADDNLKDFHADIALPYTPETSEYNLSFYFGPNKYSTLKEYEGLELQKIVPLGWGIFGWVNRLIVIPLVDMLGSVLFNYGILILILTIIIKIIILPLTYKSYLSTAKMRLLKPEMEKVNARYPDKADALKKQQATMEVYRKAGVSPMGGCIPALIQMPILIALFNFFPSSIEFRQKPFLWADDLSSFDSIWTFPDGFSIPFYGDHISLFTLLMAIALFFYSKMNYSQQAMPSAQMPGMKFMMLYVMPVMLLFFFNNYAAGLSWYYFLSNVITIGQTYIFRYAINDQKLHDRMKENAKKPLKKSKWAERMEEMQKKAAQQQAQQRTGQQGQGQKNKKR